MWLGGDQPTSADRDAFNSLSATPKPDVDPLAFSWFVLVSRFDESVRESWPAGAPKDHMGSEKQEKKQEKKKEEPQKGKKQDKKKENK